MDESELQQNSSFSGSPKLNRGVAIALNSSYFGFYAHAGFLAEVTSLFGVPSQVSGSSAGALVSGLYAGGVPFDEMLRLFLNANFWKIFHEWSTPLRATGMLFNRKGITGALRSHRAAEMLRDHLRKRRIEDCLQPGLSIGVTNLSASRAEVVRQGDLAEMIVASCSYPGLFAAHEVEGQKYWDGGIANPAPIEQWIDHPEIHTIIAHFVSNDGERSAREAGPEINIFNAVGLSHQIIGDEIFRLQSEILRREGKRLLCLRTATPRPGLTRRKLGPSLIEKGRATARENRDLLQSLFDDGSPVN